jgi:hypothetical protein
MAQKCRFSQELWEKQLEPLYLLRPISGRPVLPARLNVETAGFEPKRFVRTQPFLSRSVEKRADQSRFKSIGLYVDALMFTGAGTTTRLSPGSPTRPCCGCSSRTQGAMRCARRRARCFGAAAKKSLLGSIFMPTLIVLPRQARDKHTESAQSKARSGCSSTGAAEAARGHPAPPAGANKRLL